MAGAISPESPAAPYWSRSRVLIALALIIGVLGLAGYSVIDDVRVLVWGESRPEDVGGFATVVNLDEAFDWSGLTIEREAIHLGGPTKDGIPSLTDPPHIAAIEADFLPNDARIIGVTVDGESRAYPVGVLNWHEVINDTLGGAPIAVIYCPLCDSVSVVDRRLDGATLEFGVSGLLANSNVILYERTTDGLWSQVKLEAVSGPHAGRTLKHLGDWSVETFGQWKVSRPAGTVVTFDTGHQRNYSHSPYGGYFMSDRLMFPAEPRDESLPNKTPVLGVRIGDIARAYPLKVIDGEVRDTLAGEQIVLRGDGQGAVVIEQLPDGARAIHTFWFAWYAFHPDTTVYEKVVDSGREEQAEG